MRLQDRPADDVLRRDQLDIFLLALEFVADRLRHLRVGVRQPKVEKIGSLLVLILSTTDTTICLVGTPPPPGASHQPAVAALGVVRLSLYQI